MTEQALQDAILRTALELQRLSAFEEAQAEALLRELEDDLRQLLNSQSLNEATKREIEALVKAAEKAINARYASVATSVDTRGLVMLVADRTVETLKIIAPTVSALTEERLASLADNVLIQGAPSRDWWEAQADDLSLKFAAQVRQGVINGDTQERIVARILGRAGGPGIMSVARRNARALVHSSVMAAANDARLATFRKNARFIRGVRWLSTLDSHTCKQCAALDGQAWDLDGERLKGTSVDFTAPPAHWSCRCVHSPIPKSEGDDGPIIGQRASSLGPLEARTTFADYFKRLSPAQQDAQFGKERARLWREGKITIRDMVNGYGRELTLDELRLKQPA